MVTTPAALACSFVWECCEMVIHLPRQGGLLSIRRRNETSLEQWEGLYQGRDEKV
jgi:hypothetical protein